jgi:hypothetical protein
MKQLVMNKENSERRKAMRMGQALAAFVVDGKVPLAYAKIQGTAKWSTENHRGPTDQANIQPPDINPHIVVSASNTNEIAALGLTDRSSVHGDAPKTKNESHEDLASSDRPNSQKTDPSAVREQEERSVLFARASFLIKDALEATGW